MFWLCVSATACSDYWLSFPPSQVICIIYIYIYIRTYIIKIKMIPCVQNYMTDGFGSFVCCIFNFRLVFSAPIRQVNYVVQEAIVVIRDIFRKYPGKRLGNGGWLDLPPW